MKRVSFVLALTLAGCGGSAPRSVLPDDEPRDVFVDKQDFAPTSFAVEIVGEGTAAAGRWPVAARCSLLAAVAVLNRFLAHAAQLVGGKPLDRGRAVRRSHHR